MSINENATPLSGLNELRPKSNSKKKKEDFEELFLSIPNQHIRPLYNTLTNKDQLEQWKERKNTIDKGKATYKVKNNELSITTKDAEIKYSFPNLARTSKSCKNLFVYFMYKVGLQNVTTDLFDDLSVEFPIQELIDLKLYSSLDTARRGFKKAAKEVAGFLIEATITDKKGKKSVTTGFGYIPLFTGVYYYKNACCFKLNKNINWSIFFLKTFFYLPKSYFVLYETAQDLMFNIFSIARQRTAQLVDKGFFTMSFRNIQAILNLPKENETPHPTRDILKPILDAVKSIKEAESSKDFILSPDYNRNGSIIEILDNGVLTVTLKGFYSQKLLEIDEKKQKKIAAANKKKERIIEQAKIKNLSEKLKKEDIECQNKNSKSL